MSDKENLATAELDTRGYIYKKQLPSHYRKQQCLQMCKMTVDTLRILW